MLFDRNPQLVLLQDKHAVKNYARSRGVGTAAVLFATDDPATIPFDRLPERCFIKATHGCGWNILKEGETYYRYGHGNTLIKPDGSPDGRGVAAAGISREACVALCRQWLASVYSTREWAYAHIPPRILVEEALASRDGEELKDYRFYTFDGVVKAISVGSPTYRRRGVNFFVDSQWNEFVLSAYKEPRPAPPPKRPQTLPQMVAAAERLGGGVDFLRIDLFDATPGVVLGEITVYPEAGALGTPTSCRVFNRWLAGQWRMSGAPRGLIRRRSAPPPPLRHFPRDDGAG